MIEPGRRKFMRDWSSPVVLTVLLPHHATASPGGLRWRFTVTLDVEVGFGSGPGTLLDSPWRIYDVTHDVSPAELESGKFVRYVDGDGPADSNHENFFIDTRTAEALTGTVAYLTDPGMLYRGTFTARCP